MVAYDAGTPAVDIINAGWNGGKLADFGSTANPDSSLNGLAAFSPTLTIVEVPVNDALFLTGTSAFEANLRALVAKVKSYNSDVMFVISPPFQSGGTNNQPTTAQRASYDAIVKQVASDNSLPVVDLVAKFVSWDAMQTSGLLHDIVHPKQNGYAQIAQYVAAALQAAI
jgi:lysophospholipase L1-like esterase